MYTYIGVRRLFASAVPDPDRKPIASHIRSHHGMNSIF